MLEESLQIQPLNFVIPAAEMHATTEQSPTHGHLSQTSTAETASIAGASSQANTPSGNTGSLTDEDVCRDFIELVAAIK